MESVTDRRDIFSHVPQQFNTIRQFDEQIVMKYHTGNADLAICHSEEIRRNNVPFRRY
jgi:hypothetical protein